MHHSDKNHINELKAMKFLSAIGLDTLKIELFKSHNEIGTNIWWVAQLETDCLRMISNPSLT